jgi:predicted oxidoreductase
MVDLWKRRWPELQVRYVSTEKGAWMIERGDNNSRLSAG